MESPARSSMHIHPLVPARSSFILPSAPVPMTAALRAMSGGAALTAFAITAASDLAPAALAMPSWPDFGDSFILSCAIAVTAAYPALGDGPAPHPSRRRSWGCTLKPSCWTAKQLAGDAAAPAILRIVTRPVPCHS